MEVVTLLVLLYVTFIVSVAILAATNTTLGVRKLWIRVLIWFFEWGKTKIKAADAENVDEDDDNAPIIQREIELRTDGIYVTRQPSVHENPLHDALYFAKNGIEAIIQDKVTGRFDAADLSSWNLLTRTNTRPQFMSMRLHLLWLLGCFGRYVILFPFRLSLLVIGMGGLGLGSVILGHVVPNASLRRMLNRRLNLTCFRIMARSFSAVLRFHNKEHRARGGGICVANHTSPMDTLLLSCDNTYAMVGQRHGGLLGYLQNAVSKVDAHVWFERAESKDRLAVTNALRVHISDPNKLPVLLFPEGTCINNTSIMMFKKGSFEIGGTVYPVAMKYDPRFADAFWNSSKFSIVSHLFMIMTSWALVCDIWYLPPTSRREGESSVEFANRVKQSISAQGGLVDLDWDGGLKRAKVKDTYRQRMQKLYTSRDVKVTDDI